MYIIGKCMNTTINEVERNGTIPAEQLKTIMRGGMVWASHLSGVSSVMGTALAIPRPFNKNGPASSIEESVTSSDKIGPVETIFAASFVGVCALGAAATANIALSSLDKLPLALAFLAVSRFCAEFPLTGLGALIGSAPQFDAIHKGIMNATNPTLVALREGWQGWRNGMSD